MQFAMDEEGSLFVRLSDTPSNSSRVLLAEYYECRPPRVSDKLTIDKMFLCHFRIMHQVLASRNIICSETSGASETCSEPEGIMLLDHAWSFATLAGKVFNISTNGCEICDYVNF